MVGWVGGRVAGLNENKANSAQLSLGLAELGKMSVPRNHPEETTLIREILKSRIIYCNRKVFT